jgi:hypothetical protein
MSNRSARSFLLGGVVLALALPAAAQARPLPANPKPKQYALVEFVSGNATKFFVYTKSKTWELPEEGISGAYTKKRHGDRIEIVYVGENPLSEEECDMTLQWPVHPKTEHVDPQGTERCYTRSGALPAREVYVLGDE